MALYLIGDIQGCDEPLQRAYDLAMLDLVRWRKQVGRKGTVPLHDSILLGKAQATERCRCCSERKAYSD